MFNLMFKGVKIADGEWIITEHYEKDEQGNIYLGDYRVEPDSLSVFTGLFDIDGTPVFGGDVLMVNASTLEINVVIIWNKNEAKWQADRAIGGKFSDLTAAKVSHWKVIGNFFRPNS